MIYVLYYIIGYLYLSKLLYMKKQNGQSASKLLSEIIVSYGEGSTTISKESRIISLLSETPDIEMNLLFLNCYRYIDYKNCVYIIITSDKPRIYIGSAKSFCKRLQKHREALRRNIHHCKRLQRCFNAFGSDIIYVGILEYNCEDFEKSEENWIKYFWNNNELLNATIKTKSIFRDKDFIDKYSGLRKVPILAFDMNENFLKRYNSITEAAKELNTSTSNISRCIFGQFNHVKNTKFVRESDYNENYKFPKHIERGTENKERLNYCISKSSKKIALVDDDNNIIKIYNSISEAQREECNGKHSLGKCLQNNKKYKNKKFIYYEDIV